MCGCHGTTLAGGSQLQSTRRRKCITASTQKASGALMAQFGMGELTSLMTLTELGDVQRLSASRKAVRMAGIDIGVHRSDRRSRVGKLNRQGSPHLRWALYEAALSATRPRSPDHDDYLALKGARTLARSRVADDRAQAGAALLPHPARARARRARADHDQLRAIRSTAPLRPQLQDGTQASDQLPQRLWLPRQRGGPTKTERPESLHPERPINHHVTDHQVVDPDKPGHPRSES
jgi:Transposase IS116/IS110/IS902 family